MCAPVSRVPKGWFCCIAAYCLGDLLLLQAAGALQVAEHTTDRAEVQQQRHTVYRLFVKQWWR
jgi:hypothetical protein